MLCPACRAQIDENSVYCPRCGARLDAEKTIAAGEPAMAGQASDGATATPPSSSAGGGPEPAGDEAAVDLAEPAAVTPSAATAENWTATYSGRAMRGTFLFTALVTLVFAALAGWLTWSGTAGDWNALVWGGLMAVPALMWIYNLVVYVYRTKTIRYTLTPQTFYHDEGLFRRVRNVIEVFDIDDIRLERSLWDRIINGGVGTIFVRSSDPSHPELRIRGIDKPEEAFEIIDGVRRRARAKRGLKLT